MPNPFRSQGIHHLRGNLLKIGVHELAWMQEGYDEAEIRREFMSMIEPGWFVQYSGRRPHYGWNIVDGGTGVLKLQTYANTNDLTDQRDNWGGPTEIGGITKSGQVLRIPREVQDLIIGVTIPNDTVWYTLRARVETTNYERGTINVTTGSTTILGTGTQFTRLAGLLDADNPTARGMLFRIAAGDTVNGNAGIIEIDAIISDTELRLVAAPAGTNENDMPFSIAGDYLGAAPADNLRDIHQRRRVTWSAANRLVAINGTDDELIVADVRRTGGVVTIVDRRYTQTYRRIDPSIVGYFPQPQFITPDSGGIVGPEVRQQYRAWTSGGAGNVGVHSIAQCVDPALMLVAFDDGSGQIQTLQVETDRDYDHLFTITGLGSTQNHAVIEASGTALVPDITALPEGFPITHIMVYEDNDEIIMRTTADDGATWSARTAIWQPTIHHANDTVHTPTILITRHLRVIVLCSYMDHLLGAGTGRQLRYIYSDNVGDAVMTWSTNGSNGFLQSDSGVYGVENPLDPHIVQDEGGNLIVSFAREDGIYIMRGSTPNNPVPGGRDDDEIGANYVGENIAPSPTDNNPPLDFASGVASILFYRPRLWVGPQGAIVCFWCVEADQFTSTDVYLFASSVVWQKSKAEAIQLSRLRFMDNSSGTRFIGTGHGFAQMHDGTLMLAHHTIDDNVQEEGALQYFTMTRMDQSIQGGAQLKGG